MNNKTDIEEDIRNLKEISEWFELFVKTIIEDKRFAEFKEYNMIREQKYKKTPFRKTIENILAYIERIKTENEIYTEEHKKITKALDFKPGTLNPDADIAIQAIKNALIQATDKANKYDSLVEKIKKKKRYFEECEELIATSNDNYSDGTVIKRFIDTFQKLLDTEKPF